MAAWSCTLALLQALLHHQSQRGYACCGMQHCGTRRRCQAAGWNELQPANTSAAPAWPSRLTTAKHYSLMPQATTGCSLGSDGSLISDSNDSTANTEHFATTHALNLQASLMAGAASTSAQLVIWLWQQLQQSTIATGLHHRHSADSASIA